MTDKELTLPTTFRMDGETKARVKALAQRDGMNFTDVVKIAIDRFLAEERAANYLVTISGSNGLQHIELSADKVVSNPLELRLSIMAALREEEGDPSFNLDYCEAVSIWEFEKPSDKGGNYLVLIQGTDSRGCLSFVTLKIASAEPITNLEQLFLLARKEGDRNMVMVMVITGVLKLKN